MKQLVLDLGAEDPQSLDSFIVGRNQELVQLLRHCTAPGTHSLSDRNIYLWGEPGAGKTHLLQAVAAHPGARYLGVGRKADFTFTPEVSIYAVDDCERLSAASQVKLFTLFNQVREHDGVMIASGTLPPADLPVREDLRTRLGWGLIYQVHELTDEEKTAALQQAAHARGLALSNGVLPYLITHYRRDMRSLSAMLDALDRYSLETKRAVTLPLLRDLLQIEEAGKA